MAAKLDSLTPAAQIVTKDGNATSWFSNLWQRSMGAIQSQISDLSSVLSGVTAFTALTIGSDTVTGVGSTAGTVAAGDDSRIVNSVPNTRTISAGAGLSGGGALSANRTLALSNMADSTLKGRAAGAGTGAPQDLTPAQAKTLLAIASGDVSGLGGAAVLNVGTGAGTVASGNDSRFTNALPTYATVATDADFTITRAASQTFVRHTGTLTANRAVTLSTTGAVSGDAVMLTRTGAGAFNLTIAGKSLATSTYASAVYDGSAWYLASYGAL